MRRLKMKRDYKTNGLQYQPNIFWTITKDIPVERRKKIHEEEKFFPDCDVFPVPIFLQETYPFVYQEPCNETPKGAYKFSTGDDENKFQQNLKTQPDDWKYRTQEVFYNLNNNGYRAQPWEKIDWENSVVVLGCSCVFGTGLSEFETLDAALADAYNGRPFINLGYPGGSNEHILYNLTMLFKYFPMPAGVIVSYTTTDRALTFEDMRAYGIGPWDVANYPEKETIIHGENKTQQYLAHFLSKSNEVGRNYFTASVIQQMCDMAGVPNYHFSWFQSAAHAARVDYVPYLGSKADRARDLLHPGAEVMRSTASHIKKKFPL